MSTKLNIVYETEKTFKEENEVVENNNLKYIEVSNDKESFDTIVPFNVKFGEYYYVVYVEYDTGDSFSRTYSTIKLVDVYDNQKLAEETAEQIKKHSLAYKNGQAGSSVPIVNPAGKKYEIYAPWCGYFEKLVKVHIDHLLLKYNYN